MYETMTYENILRRMMDRVPGNIGKQEGTLIHNAIAPAAAELAVLYIELGVAWNEMFADTASREYLIQRAAERGIVPLPATHAILRGEFTPATLEIPVGARFGCGEYGYTVIGKMGDGVYRLECETAGSAGNTVFGELTPIVYIQGLEGCVLTETLIPGEDEEETEHLRNRYFDSLESQAFGGNVADYKEKVGAIQGVGGVKVYPAWEGGGTVKLVIISSEYKTPTAELVQSVQDTIDPAPDSGKGYGVAPIGHHVTVVPADPVTVDLEMELVYLAGYSFDGVKESIQNAVDAYFHELNQTWVDNTALVVRISRLEGRILELAGVLDIIGTKLNGEAKNLVLGENEIAVRGSVHEAGG